LKKYKNGLILSLTNIKRTRRCQVIAVAFIENGNDDSDLMDVLYSSGDGMPYIDIRIEEEKKK
jgi:hypothetical protein